MGCEFVPLETVLRPTIITEVIQPTNEPRPMDSRMNLSNLKSVAEHDYYRVAGELPRCDRA